MSIKEIIAILLCFFITLKSKKKIMKKIISYFVIIMFLVSMFPTNAVAHGSHSDCDEDKRWSS